MAPAPAPESPVSAPPATTATPAVAAEQGPAAQASEPASNQVVSPTVKRQGEGIQLAFSFPNRQRRPFSPAATRCGLCSTLIPKSDGSRSSTSVLRGVAVDQRARSSDHPDQTRPAAARSVRPPRTRYGRSTSATSLRIHRSQLRSSQSLSLTNAPAFRCRSMTLQKVRRIADPDVGDDMMARHGAGACAWLAKNARVR